jgi:MFS family permease
MRTEDTARAGARQSGLAAITRMFTSLSVPNYLKYFLGQIISVSGLWMQGVAQAWLVLDLTGSGTALGLVASLQFLPVLLLGPLGGVFVDRFDKRRLLYFTQTAAALLAAILGTLVATGAIRVWMVYMLASGLGLIQVIDNPTRQTFIHEMVGPDNLTNAVSLYSVLVNVARVIGPGFAGTLIATVGLAPCFFINSATYAAVLLALFLMDAKHLYPAERQTRRRGQLREGLRYVRATPTVLVPLLLMAVIGTLAYEFQVSLPLLARFTFSGSASTYATMSVVMGAGAIIGGLITAAARQTSATTLAWTAVIFGGLQILASTAPTLVTTYAALMLLGAASIRVIALGNSTLQLASAPHMRGRVMALWAVAFLGSTPIGGPIVGWVGEHIGPRVAIGMGGVAALLAGLVAFPVLARVAVLSPVEETPVPPPKPA